MPGFASARPIVRSMASLSLPPTAFERIDDLIREIGTLIVALTPLDLAFSTEVEGKSSRPCSCACSAYSCLVWRS